MFSKTALLSLTFLSVAYAQQVGTLTAESHPALTVSECSEGGSCTESALSVTLDSNWRWLHTTEGSDNCYTGNEWDATLCPDGETCASSCALDGADYSSTYGITASGAELTLTFVTEGEYSTNIGSRVYLLADESSYQMFNMKNQEFTFDVDVSNLPCGLNGALYFVEMEEDGGLSSYPTNKAGAKYGTGYCDAQCPHDIKFIDGKANSEGWEPSDNDVNAGTGTMGSCCSEMDVWEANSVSSAYTPHTCTVTGQTSCTGTDCGDGDERYDGVCDKDGCDFNSYRMGDTSFYGSGLTVDTDSPFTVVTQFITADNTTSGDLVEIRRLYVQNGKVIENSVAAVDGVPEVNSITEDFCTSQKTAFGDTDSFNERGGLAGMGDAFDRGMVLVMSIWDDHAVNMLWLDSTYPTDSSSPGAARGTCSTDSGKPEDVESESPDASVKYSNIKWGPIGSTYSA
ncbi:glycoside hydrolase family 7 protein [Cylindrobasidium torrendii FP15055 ss-10]|uniref:Glucanase n=1 Tax=Cylindrobasidium torrendii FP15055 ss-10 TaxID=1314674 RepID=A0A0D7AXP5_9AGAR|nr:glycoside hydrolase family 7 protein [Cylindrobasidium torrendii FP15055 ss-10]